MAISKFVNITGLKLLKGEHLNKINSDQRSMVLGGNKVELYRFFFLVRVCFV